MKRVLSIFLVLSLLLLPGVLAPHSEESDDGEDQSSEVQKIILETKDSGKIKWETIGSSENGFKVVWSKTENPTYPTRDGDRYHYYTEPEKDEDKLDAFDGTGTYYVRVCEYLGGKCGVYSNEVQIQLGEESSKPPVPYILIKPSDISAGDSIEVYFENNHDYDASIAQVLFIDADEETIYGSGPINKVISSKEKELVFTWDQEGNSGDYKDAQAPEGKYFVRIKYSNAESNDEEASVIGKQFFIGEENKYTEEEKYQEENKEQNKEEEKESNENKEQEVNCNNGCIKDDICYPLGHRISEQFCSNNLTLINQYKSDEVCENNFECQSNICVSGECVNQGLIQKILSWLKSFFE